MKLLYGSFEYRSDDFFVLNFSGLTENYPHLGLLPCDTLGAFDEYDFDMRYADFILNDNTRFMSMMHLIISLQAYPTVYLIINEDDWSMMLIESFLKLLQARYGIVGTYVQSPEDIQYAAETDINQYYGIRNYDVDYYRYMEIMEINRIMAGGVPNVSE